MAPLQIVRLQYSSNSEKEAVRTLTKQQNLSSYSHIVVCFSIEFMCANQSSLGPKIQKLKCNIDTYGFVGKFWTNK